MADEAVPSPGVTSFKSEWGHSISRREAFSLLTDTLSFFAMHVYARKARTPTQTRVHISPVPEVYGESRSGERNSPQGAVRSRLRARAPLYHHVVHHCEDATTSLHTQRLIEGRSQNQTLENSPVYRRPETPNLSEERSIGTERGRS